MSVQLKVADDEVMLAAASPNGVAQTVPAPELATEPLILIFCTWKVPAELLALNPYTLNFSEESAVNEVLHVPVVVVPQLALLGDWLVPWSVHVVPPSVLYA